MLQIDGLSKSFPIRNALGLRKGQVDAVRDVSFSVRKGEVYGLAGESGSGKSTIARMVVGLSTPTGGRILVDGNDISGHARTREHRRTVQMVFQNPGSSLNPRRTIGQSVSVPLVSFGYPRAQRQRRIAELLEMVHLPAEFAQRYPNELSGGQKQRVAIARALAVEPKLIVLDEPTSALDVSVQARVIELLEDLCRRFELTFLFISHDLSLMRNFAQRVGILYRGEMVESGPTAAVFDDPRHDYTRLLLASVPVISEEDARMRPVVPLIDGEIPTAEQLLELRRAGSPSGAGAPADRSG